MPVRSVEYGDIIRRYEWEKHNHHEFEEVSASVIKKGTSKYGMKFVRALDAAFKAGTGGLFPSLKSINCHSVAALKAQIATIVLAVLDSQHG